MPYILIFLSAFLLFNGITQNGFGLRFTQTPKKAIKILLSMIFSALISWFIAYYITSPLGFGVFGVFFIFPISVICSLCIEIIGNKLYKISSLQFDSSVYSAYDGIAFYSSFQTVLFAHTALQAVLFTLGGTLGFILILIILRGIRTRSEIEAIPKFFKGQPLLLVSTGLLSMIFTAITPFVIHIFSR